MNDLRSVAFVTLIPIAWIVLSLLMARLSGWATLRRVYRASQDVDGEKAHMRSGKFGAVGYHSCLSFCVNDEGLRIAVAFPFRLGHPPLFIPWDQMHNVTGDTVRYSHKVKISVGKPTLVRVTMPGWVRYRMPLEMRPPS